MAMVHEELNAMLLWSDRIGLRKLNDFEIADVQLVGARALDAREPFP
jgi:hypothetical protein